MAKSIINKLLKFIKKNPLLVAVISVVVVLMYFRDSIIKREGFRSMSKFVDDPLCTQGKKCGLFNATVDEHREKVEMGALEFSGPNQPGTLKPLAEKCELEPFNQECKGKCN